MNIEDVQKLINKNELLIITRADLKAAIRDSVEALYIDRSVYALRDIESVNDDDIEQIQFDILEYLKVNMEK